MLAIAFRVAGACRSAIGSRGMGLAHPGRSRAIRRIIVRGMLPLCTGEGARTRDPYMNAALLDLSNRQGGGLRVASQLKPGRARHLGVRDAACMEIRARAEASAKFTPSGASTPDRVPLPGRCVSASLDEHAGSEAIASCRPAFPRWRSRRALRPGPGYVIDPLLRRLAVPSTHAYNIVNYGCSQSSHFRFDKTFRLPSVV
jgi:hypothetical protein